MRLQICFIVRRRLVEKNSFVTWFLPNIKLHQVVLVSGFGTLVFVPVAEGNSGSRLEHEWHCMDFDESASWGETHCVCREPRPGARWWQDNCILADGQRDVHTHVSTVDAVVDHRPRISASQDDPSNHPCTGRRRVSELHRCVNKLLFLNARRSILRNSCGPQKQKDRNACSFYQVLSTFRNIEPARSCKRFEVIALSRIHFVSSLQQFPWYSNIIVANLPNCCIIVQEAAWSSLTSRHIMRFH